MSNQTDTLPDDFAALERQAAEWFFRKDQGLTDQGEAELQAWLRADPRHAELFAEIEETWADSLVVKDRVMTEERPIASVPVVHSFRRWAWVPATLAAAAALAVGYFGWWRPAHFSGEMITAVGDIRHWVLPDGSTIDLNTDSNVTVAYSFGERRIDLVRGEAHFAVAKNKDRPFIVSAGTVSVRAVGTAFNVRLRAEAVDVLVTEGKVRVDPPPMELSANQTSVVPTAPANIMLEAGRRVSVQLSPVITATRESIAAPAVEAVTPAVIEQSLAWQKHRVEFVDATLGEMVKEFNRYNRHQLVIDDPRLAEMRFGGAFPADDYDSFVRVLETTFGVSAVKRGESTVLRLAP